MNTKQTCSLSLCYAYVYYYIYIYIYIYRERERALDNQTVITVSENKVKGWLIMNASNYFNPHVLANTRETFN